MNFQLSLKFKFRNNVSCTCNNVWIVTFAAAAAVNGGSLLRFFVLDAELHAEAVVVARDSWSQPSLLPSGP